MTKRIFGSVCFVACAVLIASFAFIMSVLYGWFSDDLQRQLKVQTMLAAKGVSDEGTGYFACLEAENVRITWIDENGNVLYDSRLDTSQMENHLEREEIAEAFLGGYGESKRYSAALTKRFLYCAQLLEDGTVLRLSVAQSTVLTLISDMALPIAAVITAAVVLSVLVSVRLSKKMSRQEEMEKAEQMRREFTANVSHELKTPLHAISGYAELLKNGLVESGDTIPFAAKIYAEAQRMVQLVEDIISLSRLDEGAGDMKREEVDLYALAETVLRSLEPEAKEAGVSMELSGETAVINGILQLLHGILFNLCDNAVKYNRKDGKVVVEVRKDARSVIVSVSDTGIGIDAEHQERIFERFYRVDKSHSKEVGGTGLGLSIVKHAAKIHNAEIRLHSIVNKGTVMTVRFPK